MEITHKVGEIRVLLPLRPVAHLVHMDGFGAENPLVEKEGIRSPIVSQTGKGHGVMPAALQRKGEFDVNPMVAQVWRLTLRIKVVEVETLRLTTCPDRAPGRGIFRIVGA